ncbi:MAG TPA: hypothetical protein PLD62_04570 [Candidatus Cloacimonadota bacterium]|nr:hypothetical protein [Candidatus Cloacimonadota bacterium]
MSPYDPLDYITRIHKAKYKQAILPILLIVITFVINHFFLLEELKYVALLGLIWYALLFLCFRVGRIGYPESDEAKVLSPLHGKATVLNEHQLIITKSIFHPVEIRCPIQKAQITLEWSAQPVFFEERCELSAKLIGFKFGKTKCKITVGEEYMLKIADNEKVIAGKSVLFERKESNESGD